MTDCPYFSGAAESKTMQVEVRLFAGFREGRFKDRLMDLPDGTTVANLLAQLDIPAEKTKLHLINGKQAPLDRALSDGDVASLFPAIGGG